MVAYYSIFGRQVGSHYLSMAVLGSVFGGVYLSSSGKKAPTPGVVPPINAANSDEADFITKFLAEAEKKQ
ncbi:hypothetical protein CFIMG_005179RA [Ceratocystis fimbriata CBS 114723]|uniref:ATP synthase subunit K mitochondrial n=3 Tax=Ceratocystis TaxID=5157 RepID=A0A0F8B083_CERFI|nr:ATP synthase subunit K mitochondrial [Ceratocystis platani]PHH51307.1 hypothetical protein CFIMG_005179RA [Ceratocystis fimbriata CBS 114723]